MGAFRTAVSEGILKVTAQLIKKVGGVCCFSEVYDDRLMWGHYADCHRGFCLEFDTTQDPIRLARQVKYSDEFPRLQIQDLAAGSAESIFDLLLTKATCWQYENEWRSMHGEPDKAYGYKRRTLTGLYFGAKMPEEQQGMIAKLLSGTTTKLYRMRRSSSQFRLEHESITFTPIDYR